MQQTYRLIPVIDALSLVAIKMPMLLSNPSCDFMTKSGLSFKENSQLFMMYKYATFKIWRKNVNF